VCLPVCLLGVYTGSQLRRRLQLKHLRQLVWLIVGLAGISLLVRNLPKLLTLWDL
jgi:uncharacterized membrane protein YfcA